MSSTGPEPVAVVAACVKWSGLRAEVDPLHATVEVPTHGSGISESDEAALEVALRLAEPEDLPVVVVCAGPSGAEGALRELAATGVSQVVRVDGDGSEPSDVVARRLAAVLEEEPVRWVVCGDLSADRGSGSVPAFLAHELSASQALGLVEVGPAPAGAEPRAATTVAAVRRLDGGRRERLRVDAPAVLSVEGAVADLRRASLSAALAAPDTPIRVVDPPARHPTSTTRLRPWRPRPRVVPAPAGSTAFERIVELTGAHSERTPPVTRELSPEDAAVAILDQLRDWGYLDQGPDATTER